MLMRFALQKQAPFPQDMDDFFPCLVGVQVLYLFIDLRLYLFNLRLDMGPLGQYIDPVQTMPDSCLEIVEVMGRGYLDRPCAKLPVHHRICYYRYPASCEGKKNLFSYKVTEPFVLWMNRYCGIAKHSLRPCSSNGEIFYYRG